MHVQPTDAMTIVNHYLIIYTFTVIYAFMPISDYLHTSYGIFEHGTRIIQLLKIFRYVDKRASIAYFYIFYHFSAGFVFVIDLDCNHFELTISTNLPK